MTEIPLEEMRFNPHSNSDPHGRVFSWRGEIFRGLFPEWMPVWETLQSSGLLNRLVKAGLMVDASATDLSAPGFAAVLRHRRIPFVSYPSEWCSLAFRDAALSVVDLLGELAGHGLTLQDGHFGNVMLDGSRPIFVDLTSIVPGGASTVWPSYGQFRVAVVHPLLLHAYGHDRIARAMSWLDDGMAPAEVARVVGRRAVRRFYTITEPGRLRRMANRVSFTLWSGMPGRCQTACREVGNAERSRGLDAGADAFSRSPAQATQQPPGRRHGNRSPCRRFKRFVRLR